MNYFYLADDQKPVGPLPFSALQTLAASGVIKPDTLIIQEGGADWKHWRDLEPAAGREGPSTPSTTARLWRLLNEDTDRTPLVRLLDARLDRLRKPGGDDRFARGFQRYARVVTNLGSYGVLLAGLLFLVCTVVFAIRMDSAEPFWAGVGAALLSVIVHYLAVKFCSANERLLDRSPVSLPTDVVPRTLSLVSLVAAISLLVYSSYDAFQFFKVSLRVGLIRWAIGILASVLLYHVYLVCCFPKQLLNVDYLDAAVFRAGDYYASLVKFSARLTLRLGSLLFGYGMLAAVAALLINTLFIFGQSSVAALSPAEIALTAATAALALTVLPMVIHFLYLASVLAADLISAVFAIERQTAPAPAAAPEPKPE